MNRASAVATLPAPGRAAGDRAGSIFYLAKRHFGSLLAFLRDWGRPLAGRIRLLSYDDLPDAAEAGRRTYIFSNHNR